MRRLSRRITPGSATREEVEALRRRLDEVEKEIQEARRLNRRLAELTDVVQELLVPIAQRDEEKVQKYLDRHTLVL
jgi:hypothetical protein